MTTQSGREPPVSSDPLNQPPLRSDRNLISGDAALRDALQRYGATSEDISVGLAEHAGWLGLACTAEAARAANRQPPELRTFDRGGRRIDEVAFHPAYHEFLRRGLSAGYTAAPWDGSHAGHVHHAALVYLHSQIEPGTCCPMTMTYAAVPVLRGCSDLAPWADKAVSRDYDPSLRPAAAKAGATLGMAMTEKQGGSDLRATSTRAELTGDGWRLFGHKWFCSAPMSDAFLTLAQTPAGLSCFLVPRWTDALGGRNAIHLMRLKDKLGNRSNASAEIEYHGALAWPVGEPGRGITTILTMVHHTRLDTSIAPAGLMRAALSEAIYWASRRTTFQRQLIDHPLMASVLAELALEAEGSLALGMRVAAAFDGKDDSERAFARVTVALAKFHANKRCIPVVAEAMEALGGMGYVEDTTLPMLYREAPLNGIWEGSGNVIALDILRTLAREPLARQALDAALGAALGQDARYDAALAETRARWPTRAEEGEARAFAERTATLLTAAELIRHAPNFVASGYVTTCVVGEAKVIGAARGVDTASILARADPKD